MKTFIVALIIFSITVIAVCTFSFYVNSTSNTLLKYVHTLPSFQDSEQMNLSELKTSYEQIKNYYVEHSNILSLGITADYLIPITAALDNLSSSISTNEFSDFAQAKEALIQSLERIKADASFNFFNIF